MNQQTSEAIITRYELERIWRELPCQFSSHKAGWIWKGADIARGKVYATVPGSPLVAVKNVSEQCEMVRKEWRRRQLRWIKKLRGTNAD